MGGLGEKSSIQVDTLAVLKGYLPLHHLTKVFKAVAEMNLLGNKNSHFKYSSPDTFENKNKPSRRCINELLLRAIFCLTRHDTQCISAGHPVIVMNSESAFLYHYKQIP